MRYDIKKNIDDRTGEYYLSFTHKSGVTVLIAPNGYNTACAVYSADYGGADTAFEYNGKPVMTPAGIAHFLEHKLFETEDGGDAFGLFSELGADANAFTSHTSTSYTFTSPKDSFFEALRILLHFVHHPHFTGASVDRERGIIAEELNMYDDTPDNRIYYELMKCLYKNDPVRYDVGGTVQSISQIDPSLLYFCHKAFYSPENMTLVISGDIDPEKVIGVMDETIPAAQCDTVIKLCAIEPAKTFKKQSRIKMDVSEPIFAFGIKDPAILPPDEMRKKSAALSLAVSLLFGESSRFYCDSYDSGLISGDTDAGYYYSKRNAYLSVTGDSKRPFTVKKRLIETIETALRDGIDGREFERTKKAFFANFVYSMQSSSSVAYSLLSFRQLGDDMIKYPSLLYSVTADYALGCLHDLYNKDRCAFAVIEPFDQRR